MFPGRMLIPQLDVFKEIEPREMYLGEICSPISHEAQTLECQAQATVNIPPQRKRKSSDHQSLRKKQKFSIDFGACITISPNNPKLPMHGDLIGVDRLDDSKGAGKYLLFCNHCKTQFYSKTTFRHKYQHHLVNHRCNNIHNSRLQYVVGVRHRRCVHGCHPQVGCIRFVQQTSVKTTTKVGQPLWKKPTSPQSGLRFSNV